MAAAALLLLNSSFLWVGKSLGCWEAVSKEHSWLWPQPGKGTVLFLPGAAGPGEERQGENWHRSPLGFLPLGESSDKGYHSCTAPFLGCLGG